ncbi:MAG: diguanylate cyclase [Cyanobacteria bacterium P01_D01_bin.105]
MAWTSILSNWRRQFFDRKYLAPLLALLATGGIMGLRSIGAFQVWELHAFDWMMNRRPAEPQDERIVIIGIDEQDINTYGQAALTDTLLADLLEVIQAQNPTVIGLDLFRNVPTDREGYDRLQTIFSETSNIIGIAKVVDDVALPSVAGNSILAEKGQISASDLIVDTDGRVRRGFLVPNATGEALEGLAFRVALEYLASHDIVPNPDAEILELGYARLPPVESNSGGYQGADAGGYQLMMNWRSNLSFQIFSAQAVLNGDLPPGALRDKVILLGGMQSGDADVFFTPYSRVAGQPNLLPSHGIEIHASFASQLISAAFGQRNMIQMLPASLEILLIALSGGMGLCLYRMGRNDLQRLSMFGLALSSTVSISYLALWLSGWWLPVVPVSLALFAAPIITRLQKINRLQTLSEVDELTQLANRRIFQEHLADEWQRAMRSHAPLSLILCDVDYFKRYNDTYGHPQGDECLRQVAQAIGNAVRRPEDIAARYGGEEFVILLPNTTSEGAQQVAKEAAANVFNLQLKHQASQVSPYVSISLGVTTIVPKPELAMSTLVDTADLGLYEAKRRGRNQMMVRLPWAVE